jgi:hypothetical protein
MLNFSASIAASISLVQVLPYDPVIPTIRGLTRSLAVCATMGRLIEPWMS